MQNFDKEDKLQLQNYSCMSKWVCVVLGGVCRIGDLPKMWINTI
jgi:hypothetical protein